MVLILGQAHPLLPCSTYVPRSQKAAPCNVSPHQVRRSQQGTWEKPPSLQRPFTQWPNSDSARSSPTLLLYCLEQWGQQTGGVAMVPTRSSHLWYRLGGGDAAAATMLSGQMRWYQSIPAVPHEPPALNCQPCWPVHVHPMGSHTVVHGSTSSPSQPTVRCKGLGAQTPRFSGPATSPMSRLHQMTVLLLQGSIISLLYLQRQKRSGDSAPKEMTRQLINSRGRQRRCQALSETEQGRAGEVAVMDMDGHVVFQQIKAVKGFRAKNARVRLLVRMELHVALQGRAADEALVTEVTEGLLSKTNPKVTWNKNCRLGRNDLGLSHTCVNEAGATPNSDSKAVCRVRIRRVRLEASEALQPCGLESRCRAHRKASARFPLTRMRLALRMSSAVRVLWKCHEFSGSRTQRRTRRTTPARTKRMLTSGRLEQHGPEGSHLSTTQVFMKDEGMSPRDILPDDLLDKARAARAKASRCGCKGRDCKGRGKSPRPTSHISSAPQTTWDRTDPRDGYDQDHSRKEAVACNQPLKVKDLGKES
ncbi:hypothetical protein QTO34_012041, partial [Cnephaeus nilssonii]